MNPEKPLIVLVEDNPADASLVEVAFVEAGIDCMLQVIPDGVQAIEFIDRLDADLSHPRPEIVLIDLNLPKVSGWDVLKRVRLSPNCKAIKVLIISSSDAPADRESSVQFGATEYFRKPSRLEEFMDLGHRVRALLQGSPS